MQYYNLSSVGWFLDSNGNLTARDTVGNILAKFVGGFFGGAINKGVAAQNSPILTTTSGTDVHTGYYSRITPRASGTIFVTAKLVAVSNSIAGDGVGMGLYMKSGAQSPSGGTSVDGTWTLLTNFFEAVFYSSLANQQGDVSTSVIATVTPGTQYTISISCLRLLGGTATINAPENNHPILVEL